MNTIIVTDENIDSMREETTIAIKEFLYMMFDISTDCLPIGDYDRAENVSVDPFEFIDVEYRCDNWVFRTDAEVEFLHLGSAISLICQVANVFYEDFEASIIHRMFKAIESKTEIESFNKYYPNLIKIYHTYKSGRICDNQSIQNFFQIVFNPLIDNNDVNKYCDSLATITKEVIFPTFKNLY